MSIWSPTISSPRKSVAAVRTAYPAPLTSKNLISVAIRERRVVHEPDVLISGGYSELQRTSGYRSILVVPMLRDEVAIGAIAVMRLEPRLFPRAQVELLKTFAGQAVIAIERFSRSAGSARVASTTRNCGG